MVYYTCPKGKGNLKGGRQEPKRCATNGEASLKNSKRFEKPLDKPLKLWYNKDVKREEREKSKVCAEKNFSEKPKKDLTNSELYDIIKLQKDKDSPKNQKGN